MHVTRTRLDLSFSSTSPSLDIVTGMEFAKSVTSFLTPLSDSEDTYWSNVFSDGSYSTRLGTCPCSSLPSGERYWHPWQESRCYDPVPPSFAASRTSLMILILLWVGGGSLLSGKGLFSIRRVSRRGFGELILSTGVFFLLLSGLVPLGHFESMSRVLEEDWSIVFASALTAFSTASS